MTDIERSIPRIPPGWTDPNKPRPRRFRRIGRAERDHRDFGSARTTERRAPRNDRGEIPD